MRIRDWSSDVCSSDLTVSALSGNEGVDTLAGVEYLQFGSTTYNFSNWTGGALPSGLVLVGTNGNDALNGTSGDDIFLASSGTDSHTGGAGFDTLDYSRSEEHTSELQSLMRISYAVFCLKKQKTQIKNTRIITITTRSMITT